MNQIKDWIMRWVYTTNTVCEQLFYSMTIDLFTDTKSRIRLASTKTKRPAVVTSGGALLQLKQTQKQSDDTRTKLAAELKSFLKNDDDDSANAVEKYINDGSSAYLTKAVNQLDSALKDPPSTDDDKKVFTTEDCSNTSHSPILAADDSSQPAPPAPTPTSAALAPAPTPPCGRCPRYVL